MNKAELINAAAEKAGLSKKDTEAAITPLSRSFPIAWPRVTKCSWLALAPLR